jgi:hypothetical protein
MEVINLYDLFLIAREKLIGEACRPQHRLRLLVGHAGLVDVIRTFVEDSPYHSLTAERLAPGGIDTSISHGCADIIMSMKPLAINVDMLALASIS